MIGFTEHWNQYLDAIPAQLQDLYFREEYVKLYETESEKVCCFVYQDGDSIMLFPFLHRAFHYKGNIYFDFETAYGYGGPVSNDHDETFKIMFVVLFVSIRFWRIGIALIRLGV